MRSLLLLALALSSFTAHAGGIAFEKKYAGTHPIANKAIALEFTNSGTELTLNVADTVGNAENLVLNPISRNSFETVFELKEKDAGTIAKIVTTGDCQQVQSLAIVFPSGVSATLTAVPERPAAPAAPVNP